MSRRLYGIIYDAMYSIEQDRELAAFAQRFCGRLILGDVEHVDLDRELWSERFNVILLGDVVEHLEDPERILWKLKKYLAPDGFLVVSMPNVAHASVRLALLEGKFNYQEWGLLDQTHIRFFTLETITALFWKCGYEIRDLRRIRKGFFNAEIPVDRSRVPLAVVRQLCRDPEASSYQFVFRAVEHQDVGSLEGPRNRLSMSDSTWDPRTAKKELAVAYAQAGQAAFWNRDMPEARKLFYRAFALAPRPKPLMYICGCWLPIRIIRVMASGKNLLRGGRRIFKRTRLDPRHLLKKRQLN